MPGDKNIETTRKPVANQNKRRSFSQIIYDQQRTINTGDHTYQYPDSSSNEGSWHGPRLDPIYSEGEELGETWGIKKDMSNSGQTARQLSRRRMEELAAQGIIKAYATGSSYTQELVSSPREENLKIESYETLSDAQILTLTRSHFRDINSDQRNLLNELKGTLGYSKEGTPAKESTVTTWRNLEQSEDSRTRTALSSLAKVVKKDNTL